MLEQFVKASSPTLVTPDGMVMLVKPLQPQKALFSIEANPPGSVRPVRPLQDKNALDPMETTSGGIVKSVIDSQ